MNVLDSELVVAALRAAGVRPDRRHERGGHRPVQHLLGPRARRAEDLLAARPARVARKKKPDQVIGVIGCMAQKDQELIFQKAPHVDLIVGTGSWPRFPG